MQSRISCLAGAILCISFLGLSLTNSNAQPASQAANLQAFHASGQTFLTWDEVPAAGASYKLYRATSPIVDVSQATLLGSVNEFSSLNRRGTDVEGSDIFYVIQGGSAPLNSTTGLFVFTTTTNGHFYYAVTACDPTGENTTVALSGNSLSSAVSETVALPEPVPQNNDSEQHFVIWTNFQDTPLLPAMANRPGITYNFICANVNVSINQIVTVGLYGGSSSYTSKPLKINSSEFKLQLDNPRPDLFAPPNTGQDDSVNPINTSWYGYGKDFVAEQVLETGKVPNYTQRYMIYVIKWVLRHWPHTDENAVYITGSSFGGIGGVSLGFAYPDLFAAIWAKVPRFDMGGTEWDIESDETITDRYNTIWGTTEMDLPTPDISTTYPDYASTGEGYRVYDRMDQIHVVNQNHGKDFPVLITAAGKEDTHVGWNEKPRFMQAMEDACQAMFMYWEPTSHKFSTIAFEGNFDRLELLKYRRDRSHIAITNLSINDDPGDGDDLFPGGTVTGDSAGTINGYADWDPNSIVDTPTEYRVKMTLRGAVMDQFNDTFGIQSATATLTPRRLQGFPGIPLQDYAWENRRSSDNALIASGAIKSDANGLIHVTNFEISRSGNILVLTLGAPANVPPAAVASATPDSGEVPLAVQFTGSTSTDPDGSITNYSWDFGDGDVSTLPNPQHTYQQTGQYTASLVVTDNGGATDTATVFIRVEEVAKKKPVALAQADITSGPAPLTVQFTGSNSFDPDGFVRAHRWKFRDGTDSGDTNPLHTFYQPGSYNVRLKVIDNDGLRDSAWVEINVTPGSPQPPTAIAQADTLSGETPFTVQFTGSNSIDSNGFIKTYRWKFRDGTTSNEPNPVHTFKKTKAHNVRLIVIDSEGLRDSAYVVINVTRQGAQPPTAVAQSDVISGFAPLTVQFTGSNSSDPEGFIKAHRWKFRDGTATGDTNPLHTFEKPGNYNVRLIVIDNDNLQDSAWVEITVSEPIPNQPPLAVATASPDSGFEPMTVQFTGSNSVDPDSNISSYQWNYGDGNSSSLADPQHIYQTSGNFVATLIVTDSLGAADTAAVNIFVQNNIPPAAVATANPDSGIAPLAVQFTGSGSSDADGTIASYHWDFGDSFTSALADPQHSYNTGGNFTAMLIVTDNHGARDTAGVAIVVQANAFPTAIATASPDSGEAPLAVQFTGSNSIDPDGSITSFAWNFGDGNLSTLPDPQHVYQFVGSYDANLIVTDNHGAADTAIVVVSVQPTTIPAIRVNCFGSAYLASNGAVFDADREYSAGSWGYTDDGRDVTTSSPIANTSDPALYQIQHGRSSLEYLFDVANGRYDVTLHFAEIAESDSNRRVMDLFVEDSLILDDFDIFAVTGGSHIAMIQEQKGVAIDDGQLRILLEKSDPDFERCLLAAIEVVPAGALPPANDPPEAVATATPDSGKVPLAVQFTGSGSIDSDGVITAYQWDFGDGNSASEADPQHSYFTHGTFTASLIVTDNLGSSDTTSLAIQVSLADKPNAVATANPASGTTPLPVQFTGSNSNDPDGTIVSYRWDFGDSTSSTNADPAHTYNESGSYLATLIVTDTQGLTDTATVTITVSPNNLTFFRVNCSGPDYTAVDGRVFSADQEYNPPYGSIWGYIKDGGVISTATPIANTNDPALYQIQHRKSTLEYVFDLPNGSYDVILHFAELGNTTPDERVMDIFAEGILYFDDFDLYVEAGGDYIAITRKISNIVVSDGQLHLLLDKSGSEFDRVAIAAIEVGTAGALAKASTIARPVKIETLPQAYTLEQNYPNPFNPRTNISFSLPASGNVKISFYNALGQPVRNAIVRRFEAGRHTVGLDASKWPTGIYFYEIQVNDFRTMRKMILAK